MLQISPKVNSEVPKDTVVINILGYKEKPDPESSTNMKIKDEVEEDNEHITASDNESDDINTSTDPETSTAEPIGDIPNVMPTEAKEEIKNEEEVENASNEKLLTNVEIEDDIRMPKDSVDRDPAGDNSQIYNDSVDLGTFTHITLIENFQDDAKPQEPIDINDRIKSEGNKSDDDNYENEIVKEHADNASHSMVPPIKEEVICLEPMVALPVIEEDHYLEPTAPPLLREEESIVSPPIIVEDVCTEVVTPPPVMEEDLFSKLMVPPPVMEEEKVFSEKMATPPIKDEEICSQPIVPPPIMEDVRSEAEVPPSSDSTFPRPLKRVFYSDPVPPPMILEGVYLKPILVTRERNDVVKDLKEVEDAKGIQNSTQEDHKVDPPSDDKVAKTVPDKASEQLAGVEAPEKTELSNTEQVVPHEERYQKYPPGGKWQIRDFQEKPYEEFRRRQSGGFVIKDDIFSFM